MCNAVPSKPGFKSCFGFFVRGFLTDKDKQITLVAESETIRDEWVERINKLVANKDMLSGWLVEQNKKQFCVLSLVKKDKLSLSLSEASTGKIGSLTFYKNNDKGKVKSTYSIFKNTQCLILDSEDKEIPKEHRNLFPFILCSRTDTEKFDNVLLCIAETKQEREAWVREINHISDFKVFYYGKIFKKRKGYRTITIITFITDIRTFRQ